MTSIALPTVRHTVRKLQGEIGQTTDMQAWKQKKRVLRALHAIGFNDSTCGAYATVVTAGRLAIKVVRTAESQATLAYLRWAQRHGRGRSLAPKIYSIHRVGRLSLILMERLRERCPLARQVVRHLHGAIGSRGDGRQASRKQPKAVPYSAVAVRHVMDRVLNIIAKHRKAHLDLHDGNILFRGTLVLRPVLSDPIAG